MASAREAAEELRKKKKEEEDKASGKSNSSSVSAKQAAEQISNRYSTPKPINTKGKSGWEKYLADEEAKKKAPRNDLNKDGKDNWWENLLYYLGGSGGGVVDTTLPMAGTTQTIHDLRADDSYKKPQNDWTDEQRYEFGELYEGSPTSAFLYAEETNKKNKAKAEEDAIKKIQESATDNFWAGLGNTAGAIATSPFGLADALGDLAMASAGREISADGNISPFEYSQAVTGGISSHLNEKGGVINENIPIIGGKGWGDIYGLGVSAAQSMVSAYTLGGAGTLVSYFGQGMASGIDDAKSRGATDGQAIIYGTALGAIEGITEMIGVDKLFEKGAVSTIKGLAGNIIRQAGAEGLEEGISAIASNVVDNVIDVVSDNPDYKTAYELIVSEYMSNGMSESDAKRKAWGSLVGDIIFDAIGGAMSGGISGGIHTGIANIAESIQTNEHGQAIIDVGGTDDLKQLALEMSGVEGATDADAIGKLVKKVESKASPKNVGKLSVQMAETISKQNRTDIETALTERGLSKKDASRVADYLTSGEELTKKQKAEVENNKSIKAVIDELITNPESSIGTRDRNLTYARLGAQSKMKSTVSRATESGETAIHTDVDVSDKVSESGKTTQVSTGEAVTINKENPIAKVETVNGETVVYLNTDQGVIASSDVEYASETEALLYEAFTDLAPGYANALIKNYDGSVPIMNYIQGMREGVLLYGAHNFQSVGKDIAKNTYFASLSDIDQAYALKLGRTYAEAEAESKNSALREAVKKAEERAKASGETVSKKVKGGKVTFESGVKATTREQKRAKKLAACLAYAIGIDIVFYDSTTAAEGTNEYGTNGFFDEATNTIHLDIQNSGNDTKTIAFTLSHEITHFIKKWSPEKFNTFAKFLMEQYGEKGATLLSKKMTELNTTDVDYAYEEMICDACETMLLDSNALVKLMKLRQMDLSLFEKLEMHILDLINKLRTAYRELGYESTTAEAKVLLEMTDALERFHSLFEDAVVDATQSYQATIGSRNLEDFDKAVTPDGKKLFQYKAIKADENAYREMLHKWGKMSTKQIDNLFATIDNAVNLIKQNLEILDYAWESDIDDRGFSPVKPNSDKLYQVSLDFSTLCRKRILQQTIIAHLQEALNEPLTKEEGIAIRDALIALQEEGRQIEVACALCYVESARMKSPEQIKRFVDNREAVIKEFFAGKSGGDIKTKISKAEADARERMHRENPEGIIGKDGETRLDPRTAKLKTLPKKYADEIRTAKKEAKKSYVPTAEELSVIEYAKGLTVSDFTTPEGLEDLAKNHPSLFDAYTSYIRNATKSKGIENDTWWRAGDSAKIGDVLIANMNRENGLRSQSWSDFQVVHILDYIAATIELATRETKEQAYTKVPDYAELMGKTGVMINLSLIPTAKFNGSLEYDSVEGMDYKVALKLRDKYHSTVGTICIGVDNVQIKMLLADVSIDYVIPYHKSGMSAAIRKLMHIPSWSQYEEYQSEKKLSRAEAEKQAKKYGVKLLAESDPNYQKDTSFSEWFDIVEAQQIASIENANPSDKGKHKKYGVMYGGYMAMQNAANNYLKLCAERGLSPKFSHEKANFTIEENYWKLLIDRKMIDNITGEIIEQQTIKPIFEEDTIMRILNDELARYPKIKEDQDYATRRVVEEFLSGNIRGGMPAKEIAEIMKTPVDNVTKVNILASNEGSTKTGVKKQVKRTHTDTDYLDAVARGDMVTAQKMVDEAAREAGYNSPKLYHGTPRFGFTKIETEGVEDWMQWSPFFATDSLETAATYSGQDETREVGYKGEDVDIEKLEESYNDAVWSFIDLVNRTAGVRGFLEYRHSRFDEFRAKLEDGTDTYSNVESDLGDFIEEIVESLYDNASYYDSDLMPEAFYDSEEIQAVYDASSELYTHLKGIYEYYSNDTTGNYQFYANTENLLEVDAKGNFWNRIPFESSSGLYLVNTRRLAEYAKAQGYQGVKITNVVDGGGRNGRVVRNPATVYIFFNPQAQVKSADPVTYDDKGNVIPLSERFDSGNDDIRYQKKTASNREILANALESVAKEGEERNLLRKYKTNIRLIEAEQKKLEEVRKEAQALRFKKGRIPAETKRLHELDFEAKQIESRINSYDRVLLNLEVNSPLKGVITREKAMAYKRGEAKGREALDAVRERMARTQRELIAKNQESRKKGIEGRKKTKTREKIKEIASELDTLLRRPTAKKHIKENLRVVVADALLAINMDTVGADERVAKYDALIAKANDPDVIAELTKTRDRIQLQGDNLAEKLATLQNAYERIKASEDTEFALSYQEAILNAIKGVKEKVGDTSIRNMTLEQLEMVYDLYKMIQHTVRTANKAFNAEKGETIMQMAEAVNDQVRTVGGQPYKRNAILSSLQRVGWHLLKPFVAFRTIGSVTLTNLYKRLRAGEDTFYGDVKEAQAFIEAQYKKHGYKSWDMKETKTFTAKSGKTFDLTLEQMMTLYAYSRREQAHKHIIEGGIVFEDAMLVEKNKAGIPIKYEITTKDAFNLSEETFAEIANSLTAEQKAFVDEMQRYLSVTMGAKGNDVSMQLLGVKLFKEEFYLPIKSSNFYMKFNGEEAGEVKLKSPAFSKETVQHANNPIVLHSFTDLWAEHINDMAMYHSFVLALEDFTKVYSYKTKTDALVETMDTKATLETAYPGVTNYINKFLKDMNGGVRGETVGWAEKLTSLAKKGAVLGSASVVIQQPSAIMRAMAYINPKYFVMTAHKSVNVAKHKQDWEELKKYAPVAGIKEMGRFDVGMGQGTVDWIQSNKTAMEKVEDVLSVAPAFMDEVTWVSIWNAVKRETVHTRKDLRPGSEEFLKVAGERFTEVISLSQVYDSVFSRSDLMRNKSWIAKSLTAFSAEPTTTLNMIWDSWVQGMRTGSKKGFIRETSKATGAVVASIVFNAMLKSIVMAARDDDEDESYAEKYLEHFVGDVKDNLNPLTLVPVAKDVVSIFNGYDVERMDMALFSDLKKAMDAFDSEEKTAYEKWSGLVGAVSAFFGVPVKNVERDVRSVINTFFGEAESTTKEGILNAIEEGWKGKSKTNGNQLYDAMIKGDTAQIERIKGRFKDQSAINTAIRKALRENDPRIKEAAKARLNGDISEYTRIAKEIKAEGHFKQDDIVAAINAEMSAMKKGEDTTTSSSSDKVTSIYKVDDYYAAIVGWDQASAYMVKEDLIKTDMANGKDRDEAEEDFNSKFASYIRDKYELGEMSDSTAISMLVNYGDKSEESAYNKVQYWGFKQRYPDYDLSEEAVTKYYDEVAPSGINVDVYYTYSKQRSKCKGTDANGDGKTDSGSVKGQVLYVINSLPISNSQKDVLYYLNGWSASTIWEAPWR